jgi:hypothetical protein
MVPVNKDNMAEGQIVSMEFDSPVTGKACTGYSTEDGVITCYDGVSMMIPYLRYENDEETSKENIPDMNIFNIINFLKPEISVVKEIISRIEASSSSDERASLFRNFGTNFPMRRLWQFVSALKVIVKRVNNNMPISLCVMSRQMLADITNILIYASENSSDSTKIDELNASVKGIMSSITCDSSKYKTDSKEPKDIWGYGSHDDYTIKKSGNVEVVKLNNPPLKEEDTPPGEDFLHPSGQQMEVEGE